MAPSVFERLSGLLSTTGELLSDCGRRRGEAVGGRLVYVLASSPGACCSCRLNASGCSVSVSRGNRSHLEDVEAVLGEARPELADQADDRELLDELTTELDDAVAVIEPDEVLREPGDQIGAGERVVVRGD